MAFPVSVAVRQIVGFRRAIVDLSPVGRHQSSAVRLWSSLAPGFLTLCRELGLGGLALSGGGRLDSDALLSRGEFPVRRGKRQPLAMRDFEVRSIVDRQAVPVGQF